MYCKPGQKPLAWEGIGPKDIRLGGTTIVLLNGHVKMFLKYLCFYSKISAALSFGQRSLFLQWPTLQRLILGESDETDCWVLSSPSSPPPRHGNTRQRELRNVRTGRWGSLPWNALFWIWHSSCTHKHTVSMVTWTKKPARSVNSPAGTTNWTLSYQQQQQKWSMAWKLKKNLWGGVLGELEEEVACIMKTHCTCVLTSQRIHERDSKKRTTTK